MLKVKIAVVGPVKAGKTTIANFLSDTSDSIGTEYVPTIGCRFLFCVFCFCFNFIFN